MTAPNPQGAMASASDAAKTPSGMLQYRIEKARRQLKGCHFETAQQAVVWTNSLLDGLDIAALSMEANANPTASAIPDDVRRALSDLLEAMSGPYTDLGTEDALPNHAGFDMEMPVGHWRAIAKWLPGVLSAAALAPPPAVPESVRRLSEAATQGIWAESLGGRIYGPNASAAVIASYPDNAKGHAAADWPANRAFIVALVNWFREVAATPSGRADTPLGGGGTVEDGKVRVIAELLRRHDGTTRIRSRHYGTARTILNALAAGPTAPEPAGSGEREIVRHLKRGTEYEVLGEAEGQVSAGGYRFVPKGDTAEHGVWARLVGDGTLLTVYRSRETGKLWFRFPDEFRDGRFETVPDPRPVPAEPQAAGGEDNRAAIDMMAEHLLEEDYPSCCWTWPNHEDDDGYRGGGYVSIAPPDIRERLREKAGRVLIRAAQIRKRLSTPADAEGGR